jgi:electron transfer flavoprotein beta subunit
MHVQGDALAASDASVIGEALAAAMRDQHFDLILTGLQSDDQGFAQTGVVIAERLGLPHATIIMEVQVTDGGLRVKRELEAGWFQWVSLPLPAVLTIQSGINQLRYATLKGIMAAKKKEIKQVAAPAGLAPSLRILSLAIPQKTKHTEMITGTPAEAAAQLVRKLRDERRVI